MGSSDACDTFRRTATLAATGVGYVGANHGGAAHHSGILASRGVAKRRAICPEKMLAIRKTDYTSNHPTLPVLPVLIHALINIDTVLYMSHSLILNYYVVS